MSRAAIKPQPGLQSARYAKLVVNFREEANPHKEQGIAGIGIAP